VNEDAEVQKLLESVVLHKVDAEKGEGLELAKTHGVQVYPTFLMVDDQIHPIDRWLGYTKPLLDEKMGVALADLSTIDEKRARFESSPSPDLAVRLADYDAASGQYADAVTLYRKAEQLDPKVSRAPEIFDATFSGYRKQAFEKSAVLEAADAALKMADPGQILDVSERMMYFAKQANDSELNVKYLKTAIERTKDSADERVVQRRDALMPDYVLLVEKNPTKAVELRRAGMPEGWMEDPGQLNNYAWWAFENGVDQKEALALARKGAELAPAGKEKAMILDTAAELCNALDNCHEAIELTKQAIAEDPENEYYKGQLERFQEILATKS
jgi:tetratricopeptide (TPR) repeat protein